MASESTNPLRFHTATFQRNLQEEFESQTNTDFLIECKDGRQFNVHKLVLRMSSIYFKKLTESDFKELNDNSVKFPNINGDIMQIIIEFLYMYGKALPNKWETVIEIFKAAHILQVEALVENCVEFIVKYMTANTWLQVWNLGKLYNDFKMTKGVQMFLAQNVKSIMEGGLFLQAPADALMGLIVELNNLNKKAEDFMIKALLKWVKQERGRDVYFGKLFAAFSKIDLSQDLIQSLITSEEMVKQNADFLLKLLTDQMKEISLDPNALNEVRKLSRIPDSRFNAGYASSSFVNLPRSESNISACVSDSMSIYLIKENVKGPGGNLGTKILKYSLSMNSYIELPITPYPIYKGMASVVNGYLYVIGMNESKTKVFGQTMLLRSMSLTGTYWEVIELPKELHNMKFLTNMNGTLYLLH